jgi:glycosyltransferase involved in cell wall biosynthesis
VAHIGIDARLLAYRTGGISTYTRRLVEALNQLKPPHDITIGYSRKDRAPLETSFGAASLWTPPHHRLERLALSVELARHRFDVWHSPDFIPPYRGARRHVITVHDLTFWHYPQYLTAEGRAYYNAQIKTAVERADHLLVVSETTRRDLIEILSVPQEKMTIQPHGAGDQYRPFSPQELVQAQKALNLPQGYILHVGTLEPRKNIIGLLEGYRLLLDTLPAAPPVVLVGKAGWLFEETQQKIDAMRLGEKLIWRKDVDDGLLPAIYNLARVIVTPSFYEGFGMPALEAMACGIVPIVSNRSSLPEVVGDVGLLINPDDPTTIASALQKALTDDVWHSEQRIAGLERSRLFTWERSAQIALQVYEQVLRK